jgi:hypothetical protein
MPILLNLLRDYASGKLSYREVADHLNSLGYRTRNGRLFTGYTVKDVLRNRFYEGKVIFHQGLPDERIVDGSHEVSMEVRELWQHCQIIKKERQIHTRGQPRSPARHYPFLQNTPLPALSSALLRRGGLPSQTGRSTSHS